MTLFNLLGAEVCLLSCTSTGRERGHGGGHATGARAHFLNIWRVSLSQVIFPQAELRSYPEDLAWSKLMAGFS